MWETLGRQPRYAECRKPFSKYAAGTYDKRFGSWYEALENFIKYVNATDETEQQFDEIIQTTQNNINRSFLAKLKHKTKREISDRMRFRILMRDGFACQACGASPQKTRGVELHVDHIIPWTKGGETVEENLQTKCQNCNLGKGNAFDK